MKPYKRALSCVVAVVVALGCGVEEKPAATEAVPGPVTPSTGFSWVVPGELAAMPLPGRDRPLDRDAAFLEQEGIGTLVSLTEIPPDSNVLASRAITSEHLPVEDFHPPTLQQMIDFVSIAENSVAAGKAVGVHCTAGLGRSGTLAAAYLVAHGASSDDAIAAVRELRPGSIETPEQEDAIRMYESYLTGEHQQ